MFFLIWKSIVHRKLAVAAIIAAIAVGVAVVFGAVLVYRGVADGVEVSKQRLGADIVVVPDSVALEPSLVLFGGATVNTYMKKGLLDEVLTIPGVRRATPQFFTQSLTADCHDIGTQNRMLGYDAQTDWIIAPWLKKIHKEALADNEVILGAKIPTWTQDTISILGKGYTIVSIAEETGTTLDYSLFVGMEEARRVASRDIMLKKVWEKEGAPEGLISAILLQVEDTKKLDVIASDIQRLGGVRAIVAADIKNRLVNQFAVLLMLLGGIGGLTVLSSLLQLFARFYSLTWERQAEWGLYLALGASGRNISFIILGETIVISLAGAITGLALGGILYKLILLALSSYQAFPFIGPEWSFVVLAALGITGVFTGLAVLAAWLPAVRGSQTDPGTVMTRGEFD